MQVESLLRPSSARRDGGGNIALFVEKYDFVSIGNNTVICNVRDVTWVFPINTEDSEASGTTCILPYDRAGASH